MATKQKTKKEIGRIYEAGFDRMNKTHVYVEITSVNKFRIPIPDGTILDDVDVSDWNDGLSYLLLKTKQIEVSFSEVDENNTPTDAVFSKFIEE